MDDYIRKAGYIPTINGSNSPLIDNVSRTQLLIQNVEKELGIYAWEPGAEQPDIKINIPMPIKNSDLRNTSNLIRTISSMEKKEKGVVSTVERAPANTPKKEVQSVTISSVTVSPITKPNMIEQAELPQNRIIKQVQTPVIQGNITQQPPKQYIETVKANPTEEKAPTKEPPQLNGVKYNTDTLRQELEDVKKSLQDIARQQGQPIAQKVQVNLSGEIENLNTLIRKLNELITTNMSVAGELKDILNETKNASKSARVSDLIKRLAKLSSNG